MESTRIRHGTEIDKSNAARMARERALRRAQRHGRLADAARADYGHEALPRQCFAQPFDCIGAANRVGRHRLKATDGLHSHACARSRPFLLAVFNRCHEAITAAIDRDQIPMATLTVTKHPAQRRDMDLEVAPVDDGIRPRPRHQFILADQFSRVLDKHHKKN
nr:hypothetical protein [Paraburkholderia hiiakae]